MNARTTLITVILTLALIVPAAASAFRGNLPAPAWLEALNARSEALNLEHGLGRYGQIRALGAPGPSWLEALRARSDELNRRYGLGGYARQAAQSRETQDWLFALNARSEALNRHYALGARSARR